MIYLTVTFADPSGGGSWKNKQPSEWPLTGLLDSEPTDVPTNQPANQLNNLTTKTTVVSWVDWID